eukprot:TRINITY_DN2856_c0_g1_i2.p1 TRINITY_DN2856_c0_g1~~TRINITY_DN2856_c0_g1_i2.p1  ORF type:complete len:540 (-),score=222.73 TRINITY_DN2856_c0_g1_i2:270-1889(-)
MAEDDVDLSFEALTFGGDDAPPKKPQKKDKFKKVVEPEDSGEPEKNCILVVTNKFGDKLNFPVLLKTVEFIGPLKTHNFRDKQSFGFLQYESDEHYEKALEFIRDLEVDGIKVTAEKCARVTPGRDPRTHDAGSEFKNTTLVLKNLPFNLKLEQLQEILNGQQFAPINVAYLYDAAAMFRGMAFVKYRDIDQAHAVFAAINNMDIQGRKLRVEYKRTLKEGEGGEDDKRLLEQLSQFKASAQSEVLPGTSPDLSFHCPSSFQRKSLHQMAEKLGLVHYSTGEGENQFVVVRFKDNQQKDAPDPKGRDISQGRRSRTNSESKHSLDIKGASSWGGFSNGGGVGSWSKSPTDRSGGFGSFAKSQDERVSGGFGSYTGKSQDERAVTGGFGSYTKTRANSITSQSADVRTPFGSAPKPRSGSISSQQHLLGSSPGREFKSPLSQSPGSAAAASAFANTPPGTSPSYRQSAAYLNRRASIKSTESTTPTINIARQPKGPDGSGGFSPAYRTGRSPSLSGASSPALPSPLLVVTSDPGNPADST